MPDINTLEKEITCNVCFDIYEDPHILKECLHTYCLKCIKHLETGQMRHKVRCPDCRTVTKLKDVKQDFKTQRLIDLHKIKQSESVHPVLDQHQCGMCQTTTSPCTHFCTDCEIFMCAGCQEGHKNNKALGRHKISSTAMMMEDIDVNLKITLSEVEKEVQYIDAQLRSISVNLSGVEIANTQQIEFLRKFMEKEMEELKQKQQDREKVVSNANQTVIGYLQGSFTMLEKQKKELLLKTHVLKDLNQYKNSNTWQDMALTVNETAKRDIRKSRSLIKSKSANVKSPVVIHKNLDDKIIDVTADDNQYDGQHVTTLYSDLNYKTLTLISTKDLNSSLYGLSLMGNEFWCFDSDKDVLHVYDMNYQPVKQIRHNLDTQPDTADPPTSGCCLACRRTKGLHILHRNGEYHSKITDGSFTSAEGYGGDVYALDYDLNKILVLRFNKNKWIKVNHHQLVHEVSHYDSMCVQTSGIYVSSWISHCIYVFDLHGKFLFTRGEKGSKSPGLLDHPILCGMDSAGNMLVADNENHRLQVCDSAGEWSLVNLPEEVSYPKRVMMSDEGEMFMIGENQSETHILQRYTIT